MSNVELIARLRYQHLPDNPWDKCDLVEVMEATATALEVLRADAWDEGVEAYRSRYERDESLPLTNPYRP